MLPFEYKDGILKILDQTKLPHDIQYVDCMTYEEVGSAISNMLVRGAPAIANCAAYGVYLGVKDLNTKDIDMFFNNLQKICASLKSTRPTAVNLFWAIDRMYDKAIKNKENEIDNIKNILFEEAQTILQEDIAANHSIGVHGNTLIKDNSTILTHCNAGALATSLYGTALGVIREAHKNKNIKVFADETRPYLQGSRLTAFELMQDSIDVTLICDNMAGYYMNKGEINCVIVGADRIALNGDTANKIGTYSIAVLAKENNIPFYVAAPISTIDFNIKSGNEIPIEERDSKEVTHIKGISIAPNGVKVKNPAFDVTPNKYITAIITEKGVVFPPFIENLKALID